MLIEWETLMDPGFQLLSKECTEGMTETAPCTTDDYVVIPSLSIGSYASFSIFFPEAKSSTISGVVSNKTSLSSLSGMDVTLFVSPSIQYSDDSPQDVPLTLRGAQMSSVSLCTPSH